MQQCIKILFHIYYVAHIASGDTPLITRSLKLHWQPLLFHTWKVVGSVSGVKNRAKIFGSGNIVRTCNSVSKYYYSPFIWSSTCFGRNTAHHQEPKTALAASGFAYVEGCWTCNWWTLSGTLTMSTSYTSNNLPLMKKQRLPVQF